MCCIHHTYPTSQTSSELGLHWRLPWHASHPALRRSWKAIWMTSRAGDLKIASTVRAHVSDQGKGTGVTLGPCLLQFPQESVFYYLVLPFLSDTGLQSPCPSLLCAGTAVLFHPALLCLCFLVRSCTTGHQTQGLKHTRQVFYHWTALPALRTYFDCTTTYL